MTNLTFPWEGDDAVTTTTKQPSDVVWLWDELFYLMVGVKQRYKLRSCFQLGRTASESLIAQTWINGSYMVFNKPEILMRILWNQQSDEKKKMKAGSPSCFFTDLIPKGPLQWPQFIEHVSCLKNTADIRSDSWWVAGNSFDFHCGLCSLYSNTEICSSPQETEHF